MTEAMASDEMTFSVGERVEFEQSLGVDSELTGTTGQQSVVGVKKEVGVPLRNLVRVRYMLSIQACVHSRSRWRNAR